MSLFATKIVWLFGSSFVAVGGSYLLYKRNLPKDLKGIIEREGYVLATSNNSFRAMFFDRKSDISMLSINDLSSDTDPEKAYPLLRSWCEDKYKKRLVDVEDLERMKSQVLKFCGEKDLTIKGYFIKMGKTEFEKEVLPEDYKVVFSIYKSEESFLDLLKSKKPLLTNKSDIENGYIALKDWCVDNFSKDVKKDLHIPFKQISWYCVSPGYKTIGDKLNKENWVKANDAVNSSVWNDLFEKWKYTREVVGSINKHSTDDVNSSTQKEKGGLKFKEWCEAGLKKNLYDPGVYPEEYLLVKSACSED